MQVNAKVMVECPVFGHDVSIVYCRRSCNSFETASISLVGEGSYLICNPYIQMCPECNKEREGLFCNQCGARLKKVIRPNKKEE